MYLALRELLHLPPYPVSTALYGNPLDATVCFPTLCQGDGTAERKQAELGSDPTSTEDCDPSGVQSEEHQTQSHAPLKPTAEVAPPP